MVDSPLEVSQPCYDLLVVVVHRRVQVVMMQHQGVTEVVLRGRVARTLVTQDVYLVRVGVRDGATVARPAVATVPVAAPGSARAQREVDWTFWKKKI